MILHALTRHYEDLLSLGRIPRPGWGTAKVSYALDLSLEGEILALLPLKTEQLRGKKAELLPRKMEVPMPVGRSGTKPKANFLCDHSGYFLGVDGKGNPKRAGECFAACKALHLELLEGLPSPAAQAITGFFRRWDPQTASQHPALAENWKDLMAGDNLVFWVEGQEALRDPEIRAAWQSYYNRGGDGPTMCCLVTGEPSPAGRPSSPSTPRPFALMTGSKTPTPRWGPMRPLPTPLPSTTYWPTGSIPRRWGTPQ